MLSLRSGTRIDVRIPELFGNHHVPMKPKGEASLAMQKLARNFPRKKAA
jgi:hypothetical protein